MNISITVQNMPQIRAAFLASPDITSKHFNSAIKKSINIVRNESVVRTPVDTGRLRSSYEQAFSNLRGEVYPTVDYAIFVHEMVNNRHNVGEAKFMEHAIEAKSTEIEREFGSALNSALNEIARKV